MPISEGILFIMVGEQFHRVWFHKFLFSENCRETDQFNSAFIGAWKNTSNYQTWLSSDHSGILELNPGHPFAGQLSVADMKLRLSQ